MKTEDTMTTSIIDDVTAIAKRQKELQEQAERDRRELEEKAKKEEPDTTAWLHG